MKNTKYHIDLGDRKDVMTLYQSSDDKAIEVTLASLDEKHHATLAIWKKVDGHRVIVWPNKGNKL